MGYPPPPRYSKSLEAELAEARQEELDSWDEEFERRTGKLPAFSRLIIERAIKYNLSVVQSNNMFGHGTESTGAR